MFGKTIRIKVVVAVVAVVVGVVVQATELESILVTSTP